MNTNLMQRRCGAVRLGSLILLAFGICLGGSGRAEDELSSVCSTVKLEIQQDVTLERQAFDATMSIQNGFFDLSLTNVQITIRFQDATGQVVTATSDPAQTNALFFLRESSKTGIDSLSGGAIEPRTTAEIHWLIIPAPGAGGTNMDGRLYYVGAQLAYRLRGELTEMEVIPDQIQVQPMPQLVLDYFLPGQVYGDDPYTDPIEQPVPFSLGLRVYNAGYGSASQLKIESAQPRIVENLQGLLVGFSLSGSEVNGREGAGQLLVDLGTIPPGHAGVARWTMTASLMGVFESFASTFTHASDLGGELTSLIQQVNTHTLIRDVLVDLPNRDGVRDFLSRDGSDLIVFESDAQDTPVANLSDTLLFVRDSAGEDGTWQAHLSTPTCELPLYVELAFPEGISNEVRGVVRDDGKVMNPCNTWISKERERGTDPWNYKLHLFDSDRGGTYRLVLGAIPLPDNQSPVLAYIGPKVVAAGAELGFLVEASDPDGTSPVLVAQPLPPGATFTDQGNGQGQFNWQPQEGNYGVHPVRFSASDGEYEDWEIVRIYVGHPGEALTNGLPESLAGWEPEIEELWASSDDPEATVLWDSVDGLLYEVYAVADPFAAAPVWSRIGSRQEGSGEMQGLTDEGADAARRYYRLVLAGDEPDARNVWGMIRRDAVPGYTMMSPPVRTDRRFDGGMGAALAEQLHGNDGGIGSGADEVYVLQSDGSWRTLYLDASGTWREANGSASAYELPAGQGFWVAHKVGTPARLTFTGPVGNDGTRKVAVQPGFNLIGLSEGKDIPLVETLASGSPMGGATEEMADQVVIQNPDGSWRRLMFVTNWGAPYDGNWFDLSTYQVVPTNAVFTPGDAFYYLRRGGETEVGF